MKLYIVTVMEVHYQVYLVYADNEDEAKDKVDEGQAVKMNAERHSGYLATLPMVLWKVEELPE